MNDRLKDEDYRKNILLTSFKRKDQPEDNGATEFNQEKINV